MLFFQQAFLHHAGFSKFVFVFVGLTCENILSIDKYDKTASEVIKSESIPKCELSEPSFILRRKYQKSEIDLVEKEKSLSRRNCLYSPRTHADLQAEDGENVGPHLLLNNHIL